LYCSPRISGTCSTRWRDENRCKIVIVLIAGGKFWGSRRSWRDYSNSLHFKIERQWLRICGLALPVSGLGPVAGCCEHGNELILNLLSSAIVFEGSLIN